MNEAHLLRFRGNLSRDLALHVWNDDSVPTKFPDEQDESEMKNKGRALTQTWWVPQQGSGA